ncbi:MAG: glycosyltransferase family 39 protein [Planctomycetaceae bacterium]
MARRSRLTQQHSESRSARVGAIQSLSLIAATVWFLLFAVYFLSRPLENQQEVNRFDLLLLLPELLLEHFTAGENDLPAGWRYLPQRFDLIATAMFIAAGVWGIGRLMLRAIPKLRNFPFVVTTFTWFQFREAQPDDDQPDCSFQTANCLERNVVCFGLGTAAWSLLTLAFGLAGWLSQPLFAGVLLSAMAAELVLIIQGRRSNPTKRSGEFAMPDRRSIVLAGIAMAPFLLAAVLGSMLPPFAFDVKEYHLGGPKEWFLDGRVHFLPHNVYTSFPALTEMLSLSAMVVRDDWYRGALAGKLLLAGFLPLTAAAVFATGRRLFGATAGLIGAVIYATTPWAYQISVIAYAEGGLTCYLALSLLAVVATLQQWRAGRASFVMVLLAGLFAGSAMACKYTGVVQVVVPLGIALVAGCCLYRNRPAAAGRASRDEPAERGEIAIERRRRGWQVVAIYALGVCLAVGPWLVRNVVETGNPVYPLMWTVFDGRDWDAELNAKWRAAHSPPHHQPASIFTDMAGIAAESHGQSLLVFGLAPLALLGSHRRSAAWLWLYVGFLYVAWWTLTHRIDRFWVPLLPVACLLAGAGAVGPTSLPSRDADPIAERLHWLWRFVCGAGIVGAVLLNCVYLRPQQPAGTGFLADLDAATQAAATPGIAALNRTLPDGAKVLLVGEAEVFDARFPLIYNTVFDRNIFEAWTAQPSEAMPGENRTLRSPDEIRRTLADHGVTHVFVNWREIMRYRTTYGFTPFFTPDRFEELRQVGVLGEPSDVRTIPLDSLGPEQRREAEQAFPSLIRERGEGRAMLAAELYPVSGE